MMSSCTRKASGGGNKSITSMWCCCHTETQRPVYGKDVIIYPLLGTAVVSVEEKFKKLRFMSLRKRVLERKGTQILIQFVTLLN